MVTPTSLNGAGCATALPAASVDANNIVANAVVFMVASLLSSMLSVDWPRDADAAGRDQNITPA
jgi:hypothetical protein